MAQTKAALGPIVGATVMAHDVKKVTAPYIEYLGYRVLDEGTVSEAQAAVWKAPAHKGAKFAVLGPESGERQWIRFVEAPAVPDYKAMTTYGWHSLEIVVADVDAIPKHIEGSPFRHVGGPKNLGTTSAIRAMQVVGLAEEVLYLTQIPADGSIPRLPIAKSFIDRIFIVPLGTPDMMKARAWYMETFEGVKAGVLAPNISIDIISKAMGLPLETKMSICTVDLAGKTLIEIDDYPSAAKPRPVPRDSLPPGIATVSFSTDSLDRVGLPFIAEPRAVSEPPYRGMRVGIVTGTAGELIELVEE